MHGSIARLFHILKVGCPPPIVPRPDLSPDDIGDLDPSEPAGEDGICIRDGVPKHKLAITLRQPTIDRSESLLSLSQISVTLGTLWRKLLDLLAKLGLPSRPKVFLAGGVQDVAADSELQRQDPANGTDDTTLKGLDERLRAGGEEGVSVGVSGIEVFGDEERVSDDLASVGVVDDGEGVCRRAIVLGSGGRCTDPLGEGLNVWVLHPLGFVGDTLDVQCVSAAVFSPTIFLRGEIGLTSSSMCWATTR